MFHISSLSNMFEPERTFSLTYRATCKDSEFSVIFVSLNATNHIPPNTRGGINLTNLKSKYMQEIYVVFCDGFCTRILLGL